MFLHNASLSTSRRRTLPFTLGALLLTLSTVGLTACGSKPAETPPAAGTTSAAAGDGKGAPLATDAGAAKDQAILKETEGEKHQEGK